MGGGRWTANDWSAYSSAHVKGKTRAEVFRASGMKDAYDPAKIGFRESRDSADNPASTPIILASDVTGSMGMIAEVVIQKGLNTLATEIYNRKPVSDPHVMVMATGDMESDRAPLQVTQFEADIRLADQMRDLWIEGNGGGNGGESYLGAHVFAALKTRSDSFEKRGKKGYLFTIGDEPTLDGVTKAQAAKFLGLEIERDLTGAECVALASRQYEVFHLVLSREGYARHGLDRVLETWKPLLPERTLLVDDHTKIAEVVVSAIQVVEGANKATVAASWGGGTAVTVANAIGGLSGRGGGVRRIARRAA